MNTKNLGYVACAMVGMLVSTWAHQDPQGFEVRDSKGRVRISTKEDGDAFSLVIQDNQGTARAILATQEDGAPQIRLLDSKGVECGMFGQLPSGAIVMNARSTGGMLIQMESRMEDGAGFKIDGAKGGNLAFLGSSNKAGETILSVRSPNDADKNVVRLWSSDRYGRGLTFERGKDKLGGVTMVKDTGIAWFGDDAMDGSFDGKGVRIGYDPDVGASMTLRHRGDTPPLLLQAYGAKGSGVQVGSQETGLLRAGVNPEGVPKLRLEQKGGEVLLEVPSTKK